jgi:hypothetical protein
LIQLFWSLLHLLVYDHGIIIQFFLLLQRTLLLDCLLRWLHKQCHQLLKQ